MRIKSDERLRKEAENEVAACVGEPPPHPDVGMSYMCIRAILQTIRPVKDGRPLIRGADGSWEEGNQSG
jgi:hypothetical protein